LEGFGCKVFVYNNGQMQMQEENPVRGYFSTVDRKLIFGLGKSAFADSIVVRWPNDKTEVIKHLLTDTVYAVLERMLLIIILLKQLKPIQPAFYRCNRGNKYPIQPR
jgi:hypothetical protein